MLDKIQMILEKNSNMARHFTRRRAPMAWHHWHACAFLPGSGSLRTMDYIILLLLSEENWFTVHRY